MEPEKNNEATIDAFLMGTLSGAALAEFEQALAQDATLARAVEERRVLLEGLQHSGNEKLRQRLKKIHAKVEVAEAPEAPVRQLSMRAILAAAACLGLVVLAMYFFGRSSINDQQLFAQYYQTYPISFTARSNANELDSNLAILNDRYSQKDFAAVATQVDALLQNQVDDPLLEMAAAIAALETNRPTAAIPYLQSIRKNPDNPLADQATWYLALTYLKQNQRETARPLLLDLASRPAADRHQEARALLAKMR